VDQQVLVLHSRLVQKEFDSHWPEKWKSGNFLPSFNKFKNYQCPTCASDNHGRDGLLTLQVLSHKHVYSPVWLEAAEKAGIDVIVDGVSDLYNESGVYQLRNTWKGGRRQNDFTAYLLPIIPRDGLEDRSDSNVLKIIYETEYRKQKDKSISLSATRSSSLILDDLSKMHIPGALVLDRCIEFITVVSVMFLLMLVLVVTSVVIRAKSFSTIIHQQPSA